MQGSSLRLFWEEPLADDDRVAFSEALNAPWEMKSIQSGPWKYVAVVLPDAVDRQGRHRLPEAVEGRLFNLVEDPREQQGLVTPAGGPEEVRLEAALRAYVGAGAESAARTVLDEEAIERLRALGYIQ